MSKVWPPQGTDSPSFAFKAVCGCEVHGPPVQAFEYQTKTTIGPCGFPGNTAGTRYWRTRNWSGSLHAEFYDSCDPATRTSLGSGDEVYGGTITKSVSQQVSGGIHYLQCDCTGAGLTVNGSVIEDSTSCTNNPLSPSSSVCPGDGGTTDDSTSYTTSPCGPAGGLFCVGTGSALDQWTNETFFSDNVADVDAQPWDTPDASWTLAVDPSFGFGNWYDNGWLGGSSYYVGRWRLRKDHLMALHDYTVSVEVWRAAYAGGGEPVDGDFSLYATQTVTVTTDSSGAFILDPVAIPNASGFWTRVKGSTLTVVAS